MTMLEKMEKLMLQRGIKNNSELSKISGIPYTTIDGFYKRGTDNVKRSTLLKLTKALGCSLDYLIDDHFEEENDELSSDENEWTQEELQEIERFKKYLIIRRSLK